MIRVYGAKQNQKEDIKKIVEKYCKIDDDIKAVAKYSKKDNLVSVLVYEKGSSSLNMKVTFLPKKKVEFFYRNKVTHLVEL